MERILLGDNQFFGVNHFSEERARSRIIRFQDNIEIIRVLDQAYEVGIRGFMCTTHDRMYDICAHVRDHSQQYQGLNFYPCMPYAHKYANAVTDHGLIGALKQLLPHEGKLMTIVKGGLSVATKDLEVLGQLLIDAEMKMFAGLSTPVIFLQNVATDLCLGLGFFDAFRIFSDHVKTRYGAEAGFITMNLPTLLPALESVGIVNPIVCANINKIGFRMCSGVRLYEEVIATKQFRPIAMSVLASGAIAPREAIDYICRQPRIGSIVFGASSKANIREVKQLIDNFNPL